jgi:hypothetical protein
MRILAYLNTYKRYDTTLALALSSIITQTRKPDHITIFDDNKDSDKKDLREIEHYKYLFEMMDRKGITWNYVWGYQKGAHHSHEIANTMGYDAAWFLDDDQIAEPTCLEELEKELKEDVGAVGGEVLNPRHGINPGGLDGSLNDVWKGQNIQWYPLDKVMEVEHVYSSFLYRCNIVHFDLRLSKKAFRGETMFTHAFRQKGYRLILTPKARTWHLENTKGGCRSPEEEATNDAMYKQDNEIFKQWLQFNGLKKKIYVLNNGLGDHYMFLQAIPLDKDAIYAVCYPEPFNGYNVISIAQAQQWVDIKDYDVYAWCYRNNWKGHLIDAFRRMYEDINKSWK